MIKLILTVSFWFRVSAGVIEVVTITTSWKPGAERSAVAVKVYAKVSPGAIVVGIVSGVVNAPPSTEKEATAFANGEDPKFTTDTLTASLAVRALAARPTQGLKIR